MKKLVAVCAATVAALVAGADPADTNVVTSTTKLKNVPTTTVVSEIVNVGAGSPTNRLLWTSVTNSVFAKRDRADMAVYEPEREHWTWTDAAEPVMPEGYTNCPPDLIGYLNSYGAKKPYLEHPSATTWLWVIGPVETPAGKYDQSALDSFPPDATNVVFTFNRKGDLNWLFRARAVRPSTNDAPVVASPDVRLATTHDVSSRVLTGDFVAATNALWNAPRGGGGGMLALPKYLWSMTVADTYPEEAKMYYEQAYGPSACSSVRDGQFHYRNYDWNFDSSCVFVVSTLAGPGRFASVGVGGVGTNLTEEIVSSGTRTKWYKAVPGHMLDGVNEKGVCVNINVISSHSHTNGWHGNPAADGIHCLAATRWVLDNASDARMAAKALASRVYVPQGALDKGYSFHYMVSDATSTWIVEDGWCSNSTGRVAMTNVRSLDANDPCGTGRERLALLNAGGSITGAWYTKAYTDEADKRLSEFVVTGTETTAELEAAWQAAHDYWVSKPREEHRNERPGGESWWQTVHTAVYDLSAKTVKVSVQETDDWYVFSVPCAYEPRIRELADDEIETYEKRRSFMDGPDYPHANVFRWFLLKEGLEGNPAELAWNRDADHMGMWSGNAYLSGIKIPVEMTTRWNGTNWVFDAVGHLPASLGGGDLVIPPFVGPSFRYEAPAPIGALNIWAGDSSPVASLDDISAALEKAPSGGVDTNTVKDIIRDYRYGVSRGADGHIAGIKSFNVRIPEIMDAPQEVKWSAGDTWEYAQVKDSLDQLYRFEVSYDQASGRFKYQFSGHLSLVGVPDMELILACDEPWYGDPAHTFTNGLQIISGGSVVQEADFIVGWTPAPIASEHYVDRATGDAVRGKRDKNDSVVYDDSFGPWTLACDSPLRPSDWDFYAEERFFGPVMTNGYQWVLSFKSIADNREVRSDLLWATSDALLLDFTMHYVDDPSVEFPVRATRPQYTRWTGDSYVGASYARGKQDLAVYVTDYVHGPWKVDNFVISPDPGTEPERLAMKAAFETDVLPHIRFTPDPEWLPDGVWDFDGHDFSYGGTTYVLDDPFGGSPDEVEMFQYFHTEDLEKSVGVYLKRDTVEPGQPHPTDRLAKISDITGGGGVDTNTVKDIIGAYATPRRTGFNKYGAPNYGVWRWSVSSSLAPGASFDCTWVQTNLSWNGSTRLGSTPVVASVSPQDDIGKFFRFSVVGIPQEALPDFSGSGSMFDLSAYGFGTVKVTAVSESPLVGIDEVRALVASAGADVSGFVPFVADSEGDRTAVTVGSRRTGSDVGKWSVAFGEEVVASGDYAMAQGDKSVASYSHSHAEGVETEASDYGAHSEGSATVAKGNCSHAEGIMTVASGQASHSEGCGSVAEGQGSHAEGSYTYSEGIMSHTDGRQSHAEGYGTTALGWYADAKGWFNYVWAGATSDEYINTTAVGEWEPGVAWDEGDGVSCHGFYFVSKVRQEGSETNVPPVDVSFGDLGLVTYVLADGWETNAWWEVKLDQFYHSHGDGSYNVNPVGGLSGFWVGETNMADHVRNVAKELIKSKVESLTESSTAADIVNALKSIYE